MTSEEVDEVERSRSGRERWFALSPTLSPAGRGRFAAFLDRVRGP
jgi:hypothetical protein